MKIWMSFRSQGWELNRIWGGEMIDQYEDLIDEGSFWEDL